jgi:hypothetical protein
LFLKRGSLISKFYLIFILILTRY